LLASGQPAVCLADGFCQQAGSCFLFMCLPSHVLMGLFFTCSISPESEIKNEKLENEVILEVFSCQK
jgi:hypothetical protein